MTTKRKASGAGRETAKVFWSGRSQAIRLPKEFRVSGREVRIHREGRRIVLEPMRTPHDPNGWPLDFWRIFGQLNEDFETGHRASKHEREEPLGKRP